MALVNGFGLLDLLLCHSSAYDPHEWGVRPMVDTLSEAAGLLEYVGGLGLGGHQWPNACESESTFPRLVVSIYSGLNEVQCALHAMPTHEAELLGCLRGRLPGVCAHDPGALVTGSDTCIDATLNGLLVRRLVGELEHHDSTVRS